MKYGNAWELFPIEPGEVWGTSCGSRVAVHNIFDPLPAFMNEAQLMFIDPPYDQAQLTGFYTKAGRNDYQQFEDFTAVLFERIAEIAPRACYIEIGNQFVDEWHGRLADIYGQSHIQRWPVVYYRKHPTNIIRGAYAPIDYDFSGMDEADVIMKVGEIDGRDAMGDLCMGQGLVGVSAYKSGRRFVGTELNKRRLANLLKKVSKLGASVVKMKEVKGR